MDDDLKKLTIGMACYDDFDGVWFSVMALRMFHADQMERVEFLVVDNHPDSSEGKAVRDFVEHWVGSGRYLANVASVGTAATKDLIFRHARNEYVLCMDSHVLIEPDAIRRLIEYYDANPNCQDLLQGPLVYDDLKSISSHFEDQWRGEMWGAWATDPRAEIQRKTTVETDHATGERKVRVDMTENPPFEIPAQGMGVFSCRRDAWLGFNEQFRGFGGEEFYIHHKFRQSGRKVLCLPFLRWAHRFNRPRGVPYPLSLDDKFRNYVIGLSELGLPLDPAIELFSKLLSADRIKQIIQEARGEVDKTPQEREILRLRTEIAERQKQLETFLARHEAETEPDRV